MLVFMPFLDNIEWAVVIGAKVEARFVNWARCDGYKLLCIWMLKKTLRTSRVTTGILLSERSCNNSLVMLTIQVILVIKLTFRWHWCQVLLRSHFHLLSIGRHMWSLIVLTFNTCWGCVQNWRLRDQRRSYARRFFVWLKLRFTCRIFLWGNYSTPQ
jgi:hypothetical protein